MTEIVDIPNEKDLGWSKEDLGPSSQLFEIKVDKNYIYISKIAYIIK